MAAQFQSDYFILFYNCVFFEIFYLWASKENFAWKKKHKVSIVQKLKVSNVNHIFSFIIVEINSRQCKEPAQWDREGSALEMKPRLDLQVCLLPI